MYVREIMSMRVSWMTPDRTLLDAAKEMRDLDVGCLLVRGKNDCKLLGMITDRDITCRAVAEGLNPAKTKIADIMTRNTTCCFDDQEITDAAHIMEETGLHRLPVIDRYENMVGLISLTDLALHTSHELSGEVLEAVSRHPH